MQPRLLTIGLLLLAASPAAAQERLSLEQAVALTIAHNPSIASVRAVAREAAERMTQARAAYLPRVDFVESWHRGNHPVFVFSSLLAQRRFTEENFAVGALVHPEPVGNHRAAITVEQMLFDGGGTRSNVRIASLRRASAELASQQNESELALAATEAFGQVLLTSAKRLAAESAVAAAEEDLQRAEQRRDAGMATDADVLSLQVHLAQMRERQIRWERDEFVARAALNRLMAVPLDREYTLEDVSDIAAVPLSTSELEREALDNRWELRSAELDIDMAETARSRARAGLFPRIALQGSYEANGATFGERARAWSVGGELRWNLFAGLADVSRVREAAHAESRMRADREAIVTAIRLEVRQAVARIDAARAREAVGRAAAAQARESHRMIRDRYEAGLATVSDLLRAANSVLDAEAQYVAARVDSTLSAAGLRRATGRQP
jgi:outer membrane protein